MAMKDLTMTTRWAGMGTKRSAVEILHEILKLDGRKKTEIMYRTALTYPQAMRYLELLMDLGLVEKDIDPKGRDIYLRTSKGDHLLEHLSIVMQELELGSDNDA